MITSNVKLSKPLGYYMFLRQEGLKPRTAWLCCLMRFCYSQADYNQRVKKNTRYHTMAGWNK